MKKIRGRNVACYILDVVVGEKEDSAVVLRYGYVTRRRDQAPDVECHPHASWPKDGRRTADDKLIMP